ncbi:unnamed protein product [Blepharisma stoltei]|uniref:Macro domain-containing protein n=1 Tax=Blepharisma stoltei TaxID=1481888 RepID=A0AAU9IIK0_9CILI|nr:unnamed protein product [Blepharisma stoltei]
MGLCCSNQRTHTPEFSLKRKTCVNKTYIEIVQGDIAYDSVDIIVNSTNCWLTMCGSASILRHGGISIQRECNDHLHKKLLKERKRTDILRRKNSSISSLKSHSNDVSHKGLKIGDVIRTNPGHLSCQHLFHAVGPIYADGKQGETDLLLKTIHNILTKAVKMNSRSISLPAISCGIFNFPREQCAEIMLKAIIEHLEETTSTLQVIRVISQDTPTILYFEKEFDKIFMTKV